MEAQSLQVEIVGQVVIGIVFLIIAAFITRAARDLAPEPYHKYMPPILALIVTAIGVGLGELRGDDLVDAGIQAFTAFAIAWYGPDFFRGVVSVAGRAMGSSPGDGG